LAQNLPILKSSTATDGFWLVKQPYIFLLHSPNEIKAAPRAPQSKKVALYADGLRLWLW
jgi:hypothetical protein